MVIGIISFCVWPLGFVAVILGHVAVSRIRKSRGTVGGIGFAIAGLVMGYIGVILTLIYAAIIGYGIKLAIDEEKQREELFPLRSLASMEMPELGGGYVLEETGVVVYDVSFSASGPGGRTSLRIYVPPGEHEADSLPCVLVAPAGTNLLSGSELDGDDYHDETLPYALSGMVVISYTLDGVASGEDDAAMAEALKEFKKASAGVSNGRVALEFALARLSMVDPDKVFTAGHSSAANVSLLMAAHEPRLAGAIAYAPVCDVEASLKELLETPGVGMTLPGVKNFVVRSSPITHAARTSVPVFLFAAGDDEPIVVEGVEAFRTKMKDAGGAVELKTVPSGGHYQSMVDEGIPAGVSWIERQLRSP